MFWGLIMEPGRRYTQEVRKSFHISMATLDLETSSAGNAQVICTFDGKNYLLCTLQKPGLIQCPLDLEFAAGTQVSFVTNGQSHIHLTGYLTDYDSEDSLNLEDLNEEEEESTSNNFEPEEKLRKRPTVEGHGSKKQTSKKAKLQNGTTTEEESDEDEDDDDYSAEEDEGEVSIEEEDSGEDGGEEEEEDEEEEAPVIEEKPVSKKNKHSNKEKVKGSKPAKENQSPQRNKQTLKNGVVVEDLVEGSGPPAKLGRFITVYYEGRLQKNNKVFDKADKGPGFKFRLGAGEVIKGWDIGVVGMKVGGKRKIICPPQVAYGNKGSPPAIPPNSTLVFTVTLNKAK